MVAALSVLCPDRPRGHSHQPRLAGLGRWVAGVVARTARVLVGNTRWPWVLVRAGPPSMRLGTTQFTIWRARVVANAPYRVNLKVAIAGLILAGCGLSPEYRYGQLKDAPGHEVCLAASDPRAQSRGAGWKVRADAAQRVLRERNASCDWEMYARIHAHQSRADDADLDRSLFMMQRGLQMMSPGASPSSPAFAPTPGGGRATGMATFKRSYQSGLNRVCLYDRTGSEVATTIGATEICPLSLP